MVAERGERVLATDLGSRCFGVCTRLHPGENGFWPSVDFKFGEAITNPILQKWLKKALPKEAVEFSFPHARAKRSI